MDEFPFSVVLLPVGFSFFFIILLWVFPGSFLPNKQKFAWVLSLFLLFFFSYGHFYNLLEEHAILGVGILGDNKVILSLYGVLFAALTLVSVKSIRNWVEATKVATLFACLLVVVSVLNIVFYYVRGASGAQSNRKQETAAQGPSGPQTGRLPDIYYMILDGYPRADVLSGLHGYDNSEFIHFLRQHGFFVGEQSRSNYPGTALSLASSLNFNYLNDLLPQVPRDSTNLWPLTNLIRNNMVCSFLKNRGYSIVAVDSGYFPTQLRNADQFLATGWFLNEFHDALLDTTPAWALAKNLGRYSMQRKRILQILEQIGNIPAIEAPQFVFAHLMALHPPFVFGPNGEEIEPRKSSLGFWREFSDTSKETQRKQYIDQLTFINKKVEEAVEKILVRRSRPSVIILQGDHGSSFLSLAKDGNGKFYQERFSILNAIRAPEGRLPGRYDTMSPVNTFRIVLNDTFAAGYELLKDESFYSQRESPYRLIRITTEIAR